MKKTLLCLALAMASIVATAQKVKVDSTHSTVKPDTELKPAAGTFATELNFNPFKGNLSLNNALNQIKVRYFTASDLALRFGFNVNQRDSSTNSGTPYGTQSTFFKAERKSTTFSFNIGIEKHFKGTRRLSPYIGLDLSIGTKSASQDNSSNGATTSVKNGWLDVIYQGQNYYNIVAENAYTRYGIAGVAGFDFYMAKNFFLGYEFNLGYAKTDYKTVELTTTGTNGNNNSNTDSKNSSSTFGTSLINGIRIGYAF
jgi:outer membrane protein W